MSDGLGYRVWIGTVAEPHTLATTRTFRGYAEALLFVAQSGLDVCVLPENEIPATAAMGTRVYLEQVARMRRERGQ